MAPQVGLEPTTLRLTAGCSAIELLRSVDDAEQLWVFYIIGGYQRLASAADYPAAPAAHIFCLLIGIRTSKAHAGCKPDTRKRTGKSGSKCRDKPKARVHRRLAPGRHSRHHLGSVVPLHRRGLARDRPERSVIHSHRD